MGIADAASLAQASLVAAADGQHERAANFLGQVESGDNLMVNAGRAVVDWLAGRTDSAKNQVRRLFAKEGPARVDATINRIGHGFLKRQELKAALQVFELNTSAFPRSYRAWDSLGEAQMLLGRNEAAIKSYQRSLELNPKNTNAKEMIARIKARKRQ